MSVSRFYQSGLLSEGSLIWLNDNVAHHLARVLRIKIGDALLLFNGQGGEYQAVVTQITKKGVEVKIGAFDARDAESPVKIVLAQGIARGEKMDWIVQKSVELGVSSIVPLVTKRGNVRLTGERETKRWQHWQAVAVSACEQCGRNCIPDIESPVTLQTWLSTVTADYRFVLSPHVDGALPADIPAQSSIVLLIGPEGGLSDDEVAAAVAHGFIPLCLGPRVLRTETAALAAITVLQCKYGDL